VGVHGQPKSLIKMLRIHYNMPVSWSPDQQSINVTDKASS